MSAAILTFLSGYKATSTPWSNLRRLFNRFSIVMIAVLLIELQLVRPLEELGMVAWITGTLSVGFFFFSVACVIYLGGSEADFVPNPFRLISDIIVSAAFSILSFSLAYRYFGLTDTLDQTVEVTAKSDFVYFAIVSFSTLGYGDLRIVEEARLIAGAHAIIGNLHLGLLAGAVFYALQKGSE